MAAGCHTAAETLENQMITYADFGFVNHIAASIDHVYFATTNGIVRYNKIEARWAAPLTGSGGIDDRDIKKIWVDTFDEKLYAATGLGYFEYDLLFQRWFPIIEAPALESDNRHIRAPQVLYPPFSYNYSGSDEILIDAYGRYYSFSDVLDDNSGTLWIGTWGHGPAKAGASSGIIDLLPYGLLQNRVNTIYRDGRLLWLSGAVYDSYRTGISVFDTDNNQFRHIESGLDNDFPAVDVNCLSGDSDYIYVGTETGLLVFDKKTEKFVRRLSPRTGLADENVLSLGIIGDSIFVGTEGGLSILTFENDSLVVSIPEAFLNRIVYDFQAADSAVWIASDEGAFRLEVSSGKVQRFQDPTLILFSRVYDIESFRKDLWFVADAGILKLDLSTGDIEPFRQVTQKIGARALAVNGQVAAVASDRGLTLIHHNVARPYSREFTTEDGLPSNYVYSLVMDGDYLWVGTDRGLTRFWWNNPNRVD
jgi:ligand-binding sensor domain-containing protein